MCPKTFVLTSRPGDSSAAINTPNVRGHTCISSKITAMRHLTTEILSEKCVVRRFRRCAKVIECTYTSLDSVAYCTPSLYGIAYCS